jgi:hypothetical protein
MISDDTTLLNSPAIEAPPCTAAPDARGGSNAYDPGEASPVHGGLSGDQRPEVVIVGEIGERQPE